MNTVLLNQMIVIISQSFNECFSNDEQAIIGAFLTTLGDMLSLNSAYIYKIKIPFLNKIKMIMIY